MCLADADAPNRPVEAIGTHFNPGGIFVVLSEPPPSGTLVRMTLPGGDARSLSAYGAVVHATKAPNGHSGCGIELTSQGAGWRKYYSLLADSGLDGLS